jgi:enoyl-[acyl-carrier protein] reductase II
MQAGRAIRDGAFHLGGDETSDVDPDKEFMPAGQGVGAIDDLVPAAELVRRFVDEAEAALAKVHPAVL